MSGAPLLSLFALFALFLLEACSLVNQALPNQAPELQLSEADTLRVRRGGRVALQVRASDEDDDPLFYQWTAFGAGTFSDTTCTSTFRLNCSAIDWIAPGEITGNSERFVIQVVISDRQEDTEDIMESFLVEVVQNPPELTLATADTTVPFRAPFVVLSAAAADAEGDLLEFNWKQLEGAETLLSPQRLGPGRSRLSFVPFFPGNYRFGVEVDDGSDTVRAQIRVRVVVDPPLPEDGMVALARTRSDGSTASYRIDVYEYPNQKGERPLLVDSFFEAAQRCAAQGKRLCTAAEWSNACAGEEESPFSSPDDPELFKGAFGRRFCNTVGSEVAGPDPDSGDLAPAGSFPNCAVSTGVYDLSGNAAEWVQNLDASAERIGGFNSSSVRFGDFRCGDFILLPPLPADLDLNSPQAIEALNPAILQSYLEPGRGFRCCRNTP